MSVIEDAGQSSTYFLLDFRFQTFGSSRWEEMPLMVRSCRSVLAGPMAMND